MITTEADPDIVRAYREQAALYREGMRMLLRQDTPQAATVLALQAVRSAASYALAILSGSVAGDQDTVSALWQAIPEMDAIAVLPSGADVLALHDDITLYAYAVDKREAHAVADAADLFCAWALAVTPVAIVRMPARIPSTRT